MSKAKARKTADVSMEAQASRHAFTSETGKVLHLMINALYTNRDIFLRELISNASDACDKLKFEALTHHALLKDDAELGIWIGMDKASRKLIIEDNGIGMGRDELIANLGTIAKSGTQEFMERLTGNQKQDATLIGQFGVGFYSSFMVAEHVEVISRRAGEDAAWRWQSEGQGEFSVEAFGGGARRGAKITLTLREGMDAYLDQFHIEHVVRTYSDHISFPVYLWDEEKREQQQLNKGAALWMRPKQEVTEEEYRQFYKHVSHLPDFPWAVLHNRVEGAMEYHSLLFIPTMRPFDLFHPDRMRRVKLYVKRVFITEDNAHVIPAWLRFLRGVVDSQDLPLNISRETLQHHQMVDKIQQAITKRVLAELKKRAEQDADAYAKFWGNFGAVLKEGLCEALTDKEAILETCRFFSTKDQELASLDDYIARMQPDQQAIYYLLGEELEAMRDSPQLEGFRSRGIEVLLFDDSVDSFWVNVVQQYKGKALMSVTKARLDAEKKPDDVVKEDVAEDESLQQLIARMKAVLGSEVRDVRPTYKLTESPVCLAINEGDMDIRMERFLVEQKQLPAISAKILEINPEHPVIRALAKRTDDIADVTWLLLDQARIIEGEELPNPAAFARRMTALMAGVV